jgi:indolepyruvate ferredoxin oxidoreductase beta subunit
MMDCEYSILIVGVGGQGVLLASELVGGVALSSGLDVKKSEVHGMAQRGGVVSSHVRMAPCVHSPTIPFGQADVLISFEQAEGLRAADWIKKDGVAIIATTSIVPAIVTSTKDMFYPEDPIGEIKKQIKKVVAIDADKIARELGNPRLVNTILLGVLSNHLPFDASVWNNTIKTGVKPKFVDINLTAFERGRSVEADQTGT